MDETACSPCPHQVLPASNWWLNTGWFREAGSKCVTAPPTEVHWQPTVLPSSNAVLSNVQMEEFRHSIATACAQASGVPAHLPVGPIDVVQPGSRLADVEVLNMASRALQGTAASIVTLQHPVQSIAAGCTVASDVRNLCSQAATVTTSKADAQQWAGLAEQTQPAQQPKNSLSAAGTPGDITAAGAAVTVPAWPTVGGSQAQNRFGSKGFVPMFRSAPVDGAPVIEYKSAVQTPSPTPWSRHPAHHSNQTKAFKQPAAGKTCDGSVPTESASHQQQFKWVFNLDSWSWQRADTPGSNLQQTQDKHHLAARRWGDGRDQLYESLVAHPSGERGTASGGAQTSIDVGGPLRNVHVVRSKRPVVSGFDDLAGQHRAKQQLLDSVVLPMKCHKAMHKLGLKAARGVLLHGPPGSGKTSLARALAAQCGATLVEVNAAEVVGGPEAEKKLGDAFAQAAAQQPAVLFVDDVEVLAPSRELLANMSDMQQQARARFINLIDSHRRSAPQLVVAGATCDPQAVDGRLRRAGRLDVEVGLGALLPHERREVLQQLCGDMMLHPDVDLEEVARQLQGFVAADCCALVTEAALGCLRQAIEGTDGKLSSNPTDAEQQLLQHMVVKQHHFLEAVQKVHVPSSLRSWAIEVPQVSWDDVKGLEEAKQQLQELLCLPLLHLDKMEKYGMKPAGGALLYGPPGCGKTLLAKAVARQCGANFIPVSAPDILDKWLGQTEAKVRELFAHARAAAPCVLFFDEMDALARSRGGGNMGAVDGGNGATARLLNQLLVEMDGVQSRPGVFILGATNRLDVLDPAIVRPGRLDCLIEVGLPNLTARLHILRTRLSRVQHYAADLEDMATRTEGMSAAQVTEVCRSALMTVVREVVKAEQRGVSAQQIQQLQLDVLQPHQLQEALHKRAVSCLLARAHANTEEEAGTSAESESEMAQGHAGGEHAGAAEPGIGSSPPSSSHLLDIIRSMSRTVSSRALQVADQKLRKSLQQVADAQKVIEQQQEQINQLQAILGMKQDGAAQGMADMEVM